jgi:hypothetical protein
MRDDEHNSSEWTLPERSRLDALPRARVPSDLLKTRTLAALRERKLARRRPRSVIAKGVWLAVAASLVFVAGGLVGYRVALTRVETQARLAVVSTESPAPRLTNTTEHVVWF